VSVIVQLLPIRRVSDPAEQIRKSENTVCPGFIFKECHVELEVTHLFKVSLFTNAGSLTLPMVSGWADHTKTKT
jgi:hypothetical protein